MGPYRVAVGDRVICLYPKGPTVRGTVTDVGVLGVSVHLNGDKPGAYRPFVPPWEVYQDVEIT